MVFYNTSSLMTLELAVKNLVGVDSEREKKAFVYLIQVCFYA